jgi:hypothetical protein
MTTHGGILTLPVATPSIGIWSTRGLASEELRE